MMWSPVQEHKLLVRRADMSDAEAATAERLGAGLDWTSAASSVYQELGQPVHDEGSWAQYMALDGSDSDQHAIITLQYVEEGLLSVEHSRGQGAFGDDLAIEVLATEYQRAIYVVSLVVASTPDISSCNLWEMRTSKGVSYYVPVMLNNVHQGVFCALKSPVRESSLVHCRCKRMEALSMRVRPSSFCPTSRLSHVRRSCRLCFY